MTAIKKFKNHHKVKSRSKPFFRLIYILNVICQLFGVAPILDSSHHKRRALRCVHYIWCSILVLYIYLVNSYYLLSLIRAPLVTIVKVFFVYEFINNPFIVSLIAFTICYYAEQYRIIPLELLSIYKNYKRLQSKVIADKDFFGVLHKEVNLMLAVFCPIVICCFILDYIRMDCGFIYYILNTSVFNLSNVLITLNLCQYLVSLRFVYQMYRGLNEILKGRLNQVGSMTLDTYEDTANDIYISGFSWFHREFYSSCCGGGNKFKILKSLSRPYFDLDRIMAKLTKVFGIILLFNFLGSLLSLAVECFAVYKFFDNANILRDTLVDVHNRFLWLLIHVGRILLILIANHAIIEEKCRTIFIINELHITSKEMERAINRFLLRLMVHQPVEMACGAVDLDLLVLSGIAGAMANYIIFLIQTDVGRLTMERSQNITIAS